MKPHLFLSAVSLIHHQHIQTIFGQETWREAAPPNLKVGGVLHGYSSYTWNQGDYFDVANNEFDAITTTWYMGFAGFDSKEFTSIVDWAVSTNKPVHAHVLVYPQANENYWTQNPNANVEETIQSFIKEACEIRRGDIWVWDVVNEVFGYSHENIDDQGLRTFYREHNEIGSFPGEYIDLSFQWARACDPDAVLILLEANVEEIDYRSDNLYNFVVQKRDQGIPIDGIGFQFHVWGPDATLFDKDMQSVRKNFQRFADAGFRIFITEVDVMSTASSNPETMKPTQAEIERQARIFREIAELAAQMPAVESFLTWDYADDRSWMHPSNFQLGPYPPNTFFFPTPWWNSDQMDPKPAYYSVRDGLASENNAYGKWKRVKSAWEKDTSYIGREGVDDGNGGYTTPGFKVSLFALDKTWLSLQWKFVNSGVRSDLYFIRCRWSSADGESAYLTRDGIWNGFFWEPTNTVSLHPLNYGWSSQLWSLESAGGTGNNWKKIVNQWESSTGYLTRGGQLVGNGVYEATNQLVLSLSNEDWSSQRWKMTNAK